MGKAAKLSKTERINKSLEKHEDQKTPLAVVGDQKSAGEGQGAVTTKKAKKVSETVTLWKAQAKFPDTAKITAIQLPNPKRGQAKDRYALYKEGMTVREYIDTAKEHKITAALAMADMRWDFVKKFITIK
jgi:hypothetical protein